MPMQPFQNRFYRFVGDLARIWAEFWVMKYGARNLKMETEDGVWYMPFHGERYRDLIISVKIDVGASTLWGEAQTITTLDNLFAQGILTPTQYVSRLPHGIIPKQQSLLFDLKAKEGAQTAISQAETWDGLIEALPPEYREQLAALPTEEAARIVEQAIA